MSICEIQWNSLTLEQWNNRFTQIKRPNLLQSYEYGLAAAETFGQKPRWGLIKIDGAEAGLVQILEAGMLNNLIHAVIIDRGPLWLPGFGASEHMKAFCEALNRTFPNRIGRKRRFIPETHNTVDICGFKPKFEQKYQTISINTQENEDILEKKLKKRWRNALNKAKKSDLTVKWDDQGQYFLWFMPVYMQDRIEKGYDGPSFKLLQNIAKHFIPKQQMIIGRALLNNEPVAAIMLLTHGSGATYQIGWSGPKGRSCNANHLLLWQAIPMLQQKGIAQLDLGGINDETAKGIKTFKEGMGGKTITLPGIYS